MEVTRFDDALPYDGPKHFDVRTLRLQGYDASRAEAFWVGLTQFLPGGGAEMDATPIEKVYVVLEGRVTVCTNSSEAELRPLDSCRLAPAEARSIENRSNHNATMLVVMPYPQRS